MKPINYFKLIFLIFILSANIGYSQLDVACVGNSITLGLNSSYPYPSQLSALLDTNYVIRNYGHASTTILKNGEDPYWAVPEYGYATGYPQDWVVICFGTNATRAVNWDDHSNEFEDDYLDLINKFKYWDAVEEDHTTSIILCLPPPIYGTGGPWGLQDDVLINEVIPKIRNIAEQTGSEIADLFNPMIGHEEWFNSDGIHPNAKGDSVIAKIVYDAIKDPQNTDNPPPATPTGLRTISGLTSIKLEWGSNTEDDMFSYTIYRSYAMGGIQHWQGLVLKPDTTFTDNNVEIDHTYYYSIDAKDLANNASDRTLPVPGKTLDNTPPAAPADLRVIQEADTVKLSWVPNNEFDLVKYNIYRNSDLANIHELISLIGASTAPDSHFFDQTYGMGTNYYYGVKAVDISGNLGLISKIVNVTTKSRPVSSDTTITVYEDILHRFGAADFPYTDADGHDLDKLIFINSDTYEYFTYEEKSIDSTIICDDFSRLMFTPKSDEYGSNYAEFTFTLRDSFGSTSIDTNTIIINLQPINDAPHIAPVPDLYTMEDSDNIILPITGINAGPINEIQALTLNVFADDTALAQVLNIQYFSPEDSGLVSIKPADNVFGTIPMTAQILDDGGTSNGGVDTTDYTFTINVTPVNDPPIFTLIDKFQISEDSEMTIEMIGIQPGPYESDQQIYLTVISNNTDLLPHPQVSYQSPDTSAFLTFKPPSNVFGTSPITILFSDDGGRELGGIDSASYIIPVEISAVNDKPSDFRIISPQSDSTLTITKSNYLLPLSISWEETNDIENDIISYDIVFSEGLSALSRYGLSSTSTEYILEEILAVTDTVSITSGTYTVIASDGNLGTAAINSGMSITVDGRSFAPAKLQLYQNHPNPFNKTTLIGFNLPKPANISVIIFDLLGNEIIKLIDNQRYGRGYSTINWNGDNEDGKTVTTGIYIVQIRMDNYEQHKKLLFLK